jgi:hypothetical protein
MNGVIEQSRRPEMAKKTALGKKSIKRKRVFPRWKHPATGSYKFKEILKYYIDKLSEEDVRHTGSMYNTIEGSLTERLLGFGASSGETASLLAMMQAFDLARILRSGRLGTLWDIVHPEYVEGKLESDTFVAKAKRKYLEDLTRQAGNKKKDAMHQKQTAMLVDENASLHTELEQCRSAIAIADEKLRVEKKCTLDVHVPEDKIVISKEKLKRILDGIDALTAEMARVKSINRPLSERLDIFTMPSAEDDDLSD